MSLFGKLFGYILGPIMWLIYNICKNYGLSIIIFTLVSKLIVLPTTIKQHRGQAKLMALNPKISALRKQYGKNQQKFYEEQQKLYKEEGYSQFASCLPLLIQFPVLFGVLDVVYRPLTHILRLSSDAIASATNILKTVFIDSDKTGYDATLAGFRDILTSMNVTESAVKSRPELAIMSISKNSDLCQQLFGSLDPSFLSTVSSFENSFFGIDLNAIPSFTPEVWTGAAIGLAAIPILSGLVQLIMTIVTQIRQKKQNPEAVKGTGCMNISLYFFPVFSVWLALNYPAGVGFYWIFSSLFSFLITLVMYAYYTPARAEACLRVDREKAKKKKPSRFQLMLEEQRKLMEEQQQNGGAGAPVRRITKDDEEKLSRSELSALNRQLINDARKRMAEKYGDSYDEEDK